MAKTDTTLLIEKLLYKEFSKQGVFPCFEVTIGWYGKERVDFIRKIKQEHPHFRKSFRFSSGGMNCFLFLS